jgi:ABC-type nitrate/sulfonate/bicarbonate transport system permease component
VVAVQMFVGLAERGFGRGIYLYQSTYRIPETYGAIIIAGMIGILLNWAVTNPQEHMLR